MLGRLGWKLYRIWSTDWFRDAYGQRELLGNYLSTLLEKKLADMPEVVLSDETSISLDLRQAEIQVGSRIRVRYLSGAMAGFEKRFCVVEKSSESATYSNDDDFKPLPTGAPIAEALLGAVTGEVVSYPINEETIRVEVLEIVSNPQ